VRSDVQHGRWAVRPVSAESRAAWAAVARDMRRIADAKLAADREAAGRAVSPDHVLVDRLLWMEQPWPKGLGEGWGAKETLSRQVALGEMTQAHADRLLKMVEAAR